MFKCTTVVLQYDAVEAFIQVGCRRLQTVCNLKRRLHWLQPNRASALGAESALAQAQHESTKAILLTKSAMLYVMLSASSLTLPGRQIDTTLTDNHHGQFNHPLLLVRCTTVA